MFLKRNVDLLTPQKLSPWRKISIGTWRPTSNSSVYSSLELEVTQLNQFLKDQEQKSGVKINLNHFIAKACALMLKEYPQLNSIIRFGKIYPRKNIDLFFHVASDQQGEDLSGTVIRKADQKSMNDIALELENSSQLIRTGKDPSFDVSKKTIGLLPGLAMKGLLDFLGFFMYSLNLWSPAIGSPRDAFGSMMISNIGALGAKMAFVPIAAYSRVPLILSIGKSKAAPVIKDGNVVAGQTITLCFTFDHRIIDGVIAAKMSLFLEKLFENPEVIHSYKD